MEEQLNPETETPGKEISDILERYGEEHGFSILRLVKK